jgi:hypothetical protein
MDRVLVAMVENLNPIPETGSRDDLIALLARRGAVMERVYDRWETNEAALEKAQAHAGEHRNLLACIYPPSRPVLQISGHFGSRRLKGTQEG